MMPADCFWLVPAMEALRKAHQAGRLGQALLIHADPGCGGELLAEWATQLVLCRQDSAPCGECIDCRRCAAAQHPDLFAVQPTGESKQIRVTEVRDFCAELSLTSHGGGYRAGVIAPADSLNVAAANSLLKTLEEPPPAAMLMLITAYPDSLLRTVQSRCRRLRFERTDTAPVAEREDDVQAAVTMLLGTLERSVPKRLKASAAMATVKGDRRVREALGARLEIVGGLLRDVSALLADEITAVQHRDAGADLRALSKAFDQQRVVNAWSVLQRAQQALDRNASPKIVADWVVMSL